MRGGGILIRVRQAGALTCRRAATLNPNPCSEHALRNRGSEHTSYDEQPEQNHPASRGKSGVSAHNPFSDSESLVSAPYLLTSPKKNGDPNSFRDRRRTRRRKKEGGFEVAGVSGAVSPRDRSKTEMLRKRFVVWG